MNIFPINPVRSKLDVSLKVGKTSIIDHIVDRFDGKENRTHVICFDGTNGADFSSIVDPTAQALAKKGYIVYTQSTDRYLRSPAELYERFRNNITTNRAFGYVADSDVSSYFEEQAKDLFSRSLDYWDKTASSPRKVIILYGPGAYWLAGEKCSLLLFLDVTREYQQTHYKKNLSNFGLDWCSDFVIQYKIAYFVEWPIWENYRKKILDEIDFYIDLNRPEKPVGIEREGLRKMIGDVSRYPIRVKPFFAPGVWGGRRLIEMAGLPKDWVNCAWQYEPIAPENSILIGLDGEVIEIPFLIVMALEYEKILGERIVGLFGDYFPIRFDYLDTMGGENLSVQVHPKQDYITEHFNERLEQQESYYIMENKEGAKVYLGLTESCTKEEFLNSVKKAQETGIPFDYTQYVNEFETKRGDLYLIPTGTVHCSGKDNLVLEISATTWWFTFKLYDYVRKDLDGKPRPLNIDHGFANIDFFKKTDWVKENLMPKPQLIHRQGESEEYLLGQREDLLFAVKRIHLKDEWKDDTGSEFVMINLVEGEKIRVISCKDESVYVELSYAESYILPAVFGEYKIINLGDEPCKVLKAMVSEHWDVSLVEN